VFPYCVYKVLPILYTYHLDSSIFLTKTREKSLGLLAPAVGFELSRSLYLHKPLDPLKPLGGIVNDVRTKIMEAGEVYVPDLMKDGYC